VSSIPSAVNSAWQRALAAEYAAVYGYGLLGPHLEATAQIQQARAFQAEHRSLSATVVTAMITAGATAPPPQPDYPTQYPVTDSLSAQRLATELEESAAAAWRYVIVALTTGPNSPTAASPVGLRTSAQANLTAAAVRAMRWRALVNPAAPTVPFPGL
jgi:hypothetical protein